MNEHNTSESPTINKRKERNKRKRRNYKLKLKHNKLHKQKTSTNHKYFKLRSNKQWTQAILKSKHLSLQQKKKLFKHHNLCKIQEHNSALIFNLESTLSTVTFKNRQSMIDTSTISSSSTSVPDLLSSISCLKTENNRIQQQINELRASIILQHTNTIKSLKRISRNHGSLLQKRLNHISANHRQYLNYTNQRSKLQEFNISLLLEPDDLKTTRQHLLEIEKSKLASSNKIHNFTNYSPPPDLTKLLDKGTNFIPTDSSALNSNLHKQIQTEVNDALCSVIRKHCHSSLKTKTTKSHKRYKPYPSKPALQVLRENQTKPNFNIHIIDYIHNTTAYTKHFFQHFTPTKHFQQTKLNITNDQLSNIQRFHDNPDIILTKTDKNMGWGLVPISWFNTEYTRQLSDNSTYKLIENFDFDTTVSTSNTLFNKLTLRFNKLLHSTNDKLLLQPPNKTTLQIPYMKLLPKVHKLDTTASTDNLHKLTGRPIITAHSWITSNPSRLLGNELDNIILQLKDLFSSHNTPFPFIYNSTDLLNLLITLTSTVLIISV